MSKSECEKTSADVSKLISEFIIADIAMEILGKYEQKDYDFAMAILKSVQLRIKE